MYIHLHMIGLIGTVTCHLATNRRRFHWSISRWILVRRQNIFGKSLKSSLSLFVPGFRFFQHLENMISPLCSLLVSIFMVRLGRNPPLDFVSTLLSKAAAIPLYFLAARFIKEPDLCPIRSMLRMEHDMIDVEITYSLNVTGCGDFVTKISIHSNSKYQFILILVQRTQKNSYCFQNSHEVPQTIQTSYSFSCHLHISR